MSDQEFTHLFSNLLNCYAELLSDDTHVFLLILQQVATLKHLPVGRQEFRVTVRIN